MARLRGVFFPVHSGGHVKPTQNLPAVSAKKNLAGEAARITPRCKSSQDPVSGRLMVLGLFLLFAHAGFAQGIQPFSTQVPGPFSTVDMATSNIVVSIPIRAKLGAIPFQYSLIVNSSPQTGVAQTELKGQLMGPAALMNGGALPQIKLAPCGTQNDTEYFNWSFIDATGASHPFSGPSVIAGPYTGCDSIGSFTGQAKDGSGYTLTVTVAANGTFSTQIWDKSGNTKPEYTNAVNDPNGNSISYSWVNTGGSHGTYTYTDTLGQRVLQTIFNGGPSSDTYVYTDKNGGNQTYTVGYTSMHWKTVFGGICGDYDVAGAYFPTTVTETPSGQQYTLAYETTPGFPAGYTTGRIQQITFPSGGFIKYAYSGGSDGLKCSGSGGFGIATLTKTINDGNGHNDTWTYTNNSNGSSWNYTVVETDPAGNQTVYTFYGAYQTEKQTYQGPASANNLIGTTVTCYNGNFSNCPTAAFSVAPTLVLRISQTDVFTYPGGSSSASLVETKLNPTGTIAEVKQYDFGAATSLPPTAAPAISPVADITTTYDGNGASCGTLASGSNINDRPCSVTTKDSSGATVSQVQYTYNATGHPTQTSTLVSGSTYLTSSAFYNPNGTTASFTDANTAVTNYFYNGTGGCNNLLLTSTSFPVNRLSASQTWDCNGGVLTSTTDENGQVTSYGYVSQSGTADPFWRVLSTTDPLGNTTVNTYANPTTQETSLVFNNNGSTVDTLTTLDGLGRQLVVQQRQAPGSSNFDSVQYAYGWTTNIGPFTTVSLPYVGTAGQGTPTGTAVTTTQNDALGRTKSVTDGGGGSTSYQYTLQDVLITLGPAPSGENSKRRQLENDGLGRLKSVCEITGVGGSGSCAQASAATGYLTTYSYDALGNLLSVSQNAQGSPIQTRTYTYDALGRLTSEKNPEWNYATATYTYDVDSGGTCSGSYNGDLVKTTDAAGNVTCSKFDGLHRLATVTYPSGPNAANTPAKAFIYDSTTFSCASAPRTIGNVGGRLAEAYTSSSGSKITDIGFCYSARGETTDVYESTPHSSGYYHTVMNYWPNGTVNILAGYLASGSTFAPTQTYGLDGEGRWKTVTAASGPNPISTTGYNAASQITGITYGSTDTDSFLYDNAARMNKYTFTLNGSSAVGTPTWNANGTLKTLAITDPFNSSDNQTCTYSYDDLGRITSANCGTPWSQTFSYDPFGNLTKSGSISWQPGYDQTTNRYMLSGTSYDADGNLTNDSFHSYSWDANGRPASLGGKMMTYDALGRMVEKLDGSTYTQFAYSPSGTLFARMSGQSATSVRVPLPGSSAVYGSGNTFNHYEHLDWLGNSRLSSSQSRTMISDIAYAPFGEPYGSTATSGVSFTGMRSDVLAVSGGVTNGLYDFLARELPPTQGRWLSPDPAGPGAVEPANPQSWNRYAYALNNPLALTDPLGLFCVWDNGSFDANDDPLTGNQQDCENKYGGTWFNGDPSNWIDQNGNPVFGSNDWSADTNELAAALAYGINPTGVAPWGEESGVPDASVSAVAEPVEVIISSLAPTAPFTPCTSRNGRPYAPGHQARDYHLPSYGTSIPAPENGAVTGGRSNAAHIPGPYDYSHTATGPANFTQFTAVSGYILSYVHVRPAVPVGASVRQGDTIGTSDNSGRITGPHTHVQITSPSGARIDPNIYFAGVCQ